MNGRKTGVKKMNNDTMSAKQKVRLKAVDNSFAKYDER